MKTMNVFLAKIAILTLLTFNLTFSIDSSTNSVEFGVSQAHAQLMGKMFKEVEGTIYCNGVLTTVTVCISGKDYCTPGKCDSNDQ